MTQAVQLFAQLTAAGTLLTAQGVFQSLAQIVQRRTRLAQKQHDQQHDRDDDGDQQQDQQGGGFGHGVNVTGRISNRATRAAMPARFASGPSSLSTRVAMGRYPNSSRALEM